MNFSKAIIFVAFFLLSFIKIVYAQSLDIQTDTTGYIKGENDYNLLVASEKGILSDVEMFLKAGADINTKTLEGVTPLMYAAQKGYLEIVEFLLEKGADAELKPLDGLSALHSAVMFNQLDVVELLIRKEVNINIQDKKDVTPLMYAIAYDYFVMADMLIYYGASLNSVDKYGNSPLTVAAYVGSFELTKLLLENGADVDHQDEKGNTPLIIASQFGYNDIADLLILYSADINIQNYSNLSALHYAVDSNNNELVKLLTRKGANVNQNVSYAENLLTIANRNKNDSIKTLLQEHGLKKNYYPHISAFSMGINMDFNADDYMNGLQFMFDEEKYKFSLNAGFEFRPKRISVLEEKEDNLYYQFWERRSILYAGGLKSFQLHEISYDQSIEMFIAANVGYTWGNYRGYIQGPDSKFVFMPEAGLMVRKSHSRFIFSYQYKDFKIEDVSPHRFNFSMMFTVNFVNNKFKTHYISWLK